MAACVAQAQACFAGVTLCAVVIWRVCLHDILLRYVRINLQSMISRLLVPKVYAQISSHMSCKTCKGKSHLRIDCLPTGANDSAQYAVRQTVLNVRQAPCSAVAMHCSVEQPSAVTVLHILLGYTYMSAYLTGDQHAPPDHAPLRLYMHYKFYSRSSRVSFLSHVL